MIALLGFRYWEKSIPVGSVTWVNSSIPEDAQHDKHNSQHLDYQVSHLMLKGLQTTKQHTGIPAEYIT